MLLYSMSAAVDAVSACVISEFDIFLLFFSFLHLHRYRYFFQVSKPTTNFYFLRSSLISKVCQNYR